MSPLLSFLNEDGRRCEKQIVNSIEHFFSFLATLYTPRRAAMTVFMVIGITLCLIFLGPIFNVWLTPMLKPVTVNYLGYITFLNATLGVGLSVLLFSLLEHLINFFNKQIENFSNTKKIKKINQEIINTQERQKTSFIKQFKHAFEFIDVEHLSLLRHLVIEGNCSLLNTSERVAFLRNQKWIKAIAQVNKHESVYEINPLIKELIEEDWKKERDSLVNTALLSTEQALKDILKWFSLDNTDKDYKIEYNDFFSAEAQSILRACFNCNGSLKNMTIMFNNHYKESFEVAVQRKLKDKILISIYSKSSYDHSSDLVF